MVWKIEWQGRPEGPRGPRGVEGMLGWWVREGLCHNTLWLINGLWCTLGNKVKGLHTQSSVASSSMVIQIIEFTEWNVFLFLNSFIDICLSFGSRSFQVILTCLCGLWWLLVFLCYTWWGFHLYHPLGNQKLPKGKEPCLSPISFFSVVFISSPTFQNERGWPRVTPEVGSQRIEILLAE